MVPSLLDATGAWSARSLAFAAIWISAAHSLQYLWVTFNYAKRSVRGTRLREYLWKTTLAGNAAIIIPGIVFSPLLLGASLNWDEGLGTLIFAVINLHHFMLDGAVWKLRDGKVARTLLRDPVDSGRVLPTRPTARLRQLTIALWVTLAACFTIELFELARHHAQTLGAHRVAEAMFDALGGAGREHPIQRIRFGRALFEEGEYERARIEFRKSLAALPTVAGWGGVGRTLDAERDFAGAARAYEMGLEVDPNDTALLRSAALAHTKLGESERAVELLERALEVEPENATTRAFLAGARHRLEASGDR